MQRQRRSSQETTVQPWGRGPGSASSDTSNNVSEFFAEPKSPTVKDLSIPLSKEDHQRPD